MDENNVYDAIALSIIKNQENIIGPIAVERAQYVTGLNVDWQNKIVHITAEPLATIDNLVEQYTVLFGQLSVEVCKEATNRFRTQLDTKQLPASLR
ncbi:MAG: hypothetical protein Q7T41_03520 [Candidatus Saccharibacteria bacterium]|nr:hypothetical protein [Candidatus Saccharibacteria bacterium]